MQVRPFSFQGASSSVSSTNALALLGDARMQSGAAESEDVRDRREREDEHAAAVAAALAPNDPASVINQAERDVSRSSRAFKRQTAREEGVNQFREQRQSFKEALSDVSSAGARKPPSGSQTPEKAGASSTQAKPDAKSDARKAEIPNQSSSSKSQNTASKAGDGETAARSSDSGAGQQRAAGAAASSSGSSANGGGFAVGAARVTQAGGIRAISSASSAARGAVSRPSGGASKPGAVATGLANKARGSFRTSATSAARSGEADASRSAERQANIDRIVRIVRGSFNARHSHSVMRIDPPDLGSLRLQMDLRGESLTLRIDTSTDVAHRLLLEDVHKLRDGLEASGVRLERIEVRPPTPPVEEQAVSRDADTHDDTDRGSAEANAEHSQERGTDSLPAEPTDGAAREDYSEPAAESLVNVIA